VSLQPDVVINLKIGFLHAVRHNSRVVVNFSLARTGYS
jgi:hypothetical protein